MVVRAHRSHRQFVQGLLDDAQRLAHLMDADEVTGVDVAGGFNGHFEIVLFVAGIRREFAVIMRDAGTAQAGAGQSPGQGILSQRSCRSRRYGR